MNSARGQARVTSITLFSISRLVPRKNVDVLIAAVEQLVNEGAALTLVIAGTGPEEERIRRLAARLPGTVRFLGFIDEQRKRSILSETDVFVQLSTREGLSIAALEALASGVPCVVSDLPGVREPVTQGRTGWYVDDPENVQSVVAALRRVLADRAAASGDETRLSCRGRGAILAGRPCARATGRCSRVLWGRRHDGRKRSRSAHHPRHGRSRLHRIGAVRAAAIGRASGRRATTTSRAAAASTCRRA